MTIATGENPLRHGIFADSVVDSETLRPREARAADRHSPAVWNSAADAGLSCTTIDWPATGGDDALVDPLFAADITKQIKSLDSARHADTASREIPAQEKDSERMRSSLAQMLLRVQATSKAIDHLLKSDQPPALIAWTYRCVRFKKSSSPAGCSAIRAAFMQSLSLVNPETLVLVVQQDSHQSRLSIIGAPTQPSSNVRLRLAAVASAARGALGVPLPTGTPPIDLSTVGLPIGPAQPMDHPLGVANSGPNIVELASRILALDKGPQRKRATLIVRRLATTAARMAQNGLDWSQAADYARALVLLNGTAQDHWLLVFSLQRLNKQDDLAAAAAAFSAAHPDVPASCVGTALALMQHEPAQAAAMVETIDVDSVKVDGVIGAMGRVMMQCGDKTRGRALLRTALDRGAGLESDRILIAHDALNEGDPKGALAVLTFVGKARTQSLRTRLLRGEIFVALDRLDEARAIAAELVEDYPGESSAEALMQMATAVR